MDGYSSYTLYVMVVSKIFFGVSVYNFVVEKKKWKSGKIGNALE